MKGINMPPDLNKRIRAQVTEVKTPSDIAFIMRKIAQFQPMSILSADYSEGHWIITATSTPILKDIEVDSSIRSISNQLESSLREYIDHADTPQIRGKIRSISKQFAYDRGFPLATAVINEERNGNLINLEISLEFNTPCIISGVDDKLGLPTLSILKIGIGQLCDKENFQSAFDNIESELRALGYADAAVDSPQIVFSKSSTEATLVITGTLGPKYAYRALIDGKERSVEDVLSDLGSTSANLASFGPESMKAELLRVYRNEGFVDVKVSEPSLDNSSSGLSKYIYTIEPGPRYEVANIEFEGVRAFEQEELINAIGWSGFWDNRANLNMNEISQGMESIAAQYQTKGFWNVKVRDPRITKNPDEGTANLVIFVNEGKQSVFNKIEFVGNSAFSSDELKQSLGLEVASAIDRSQLVEFERKLRSRYIESGYLYIDVKTTITTETTNTRNSVSINIDLIEGPRVKVGLIYIKGLTRTKPIVVRRELTFQSGDWYSPSKIDHSRRDLINLGLFRSVQIKPIDNRSVDERAGILDLIIDLRESKPGNISFGPGWSFHRGQRFSIESTYKNIAGIGRQIFARAQISEEKHQIPIDNETMIGRKLSIGYVEPYILNLPVDGSIALSTKAEAGDFRERSTAFETALSHRLRFGYLRGGIVKPFYGQKFTECYSSTALNRDDCPSNLLRIGRVGLRFRFDKRNDISWPTDGYYFSSETSWARYHFGGNVQYFFWNIENNYFFDLGRQIVGAVGVEFASFSDVGRKNSTSQVLPLTERLSLDGTRLVRGFREKSLSPIRKFFPDDKGNKTKDSNIQGSQLSLFHFELRKQLIPKTLALTTFVDSGTVFFRRSEIAQFDQAKGYVVDNAPYDIGDLVENPQHLWTYHYTSYGLAVNYLTPIGSVNLAYGLPWKRCADRDSCTSPRGEQSSYRILDGQFHINIGATF